MFVLNSGQQHIIKVKFCNHESEAQTLIRNGFWPGTPKQPKVAFDIRLMNIFYYFFLECRITWKKIYDAIQWLVPSLLKVYVSS